MNNSSTKLLRTFLVLTALLIGGLYLGVTFLGQDWNSQGRYLLSLLQLLLTILLSAAALVFIYKLLTKAWDELVNRSGRKLEANKTPDESPQDFKDR
jgi:Ni,Fe-hydrogenase I cytochrome b subunit